MTSVKALRRFVTTLDQKSSQFREFKEGEVVSDPGIIQFLRSQNVPIVDWNDNDTAICKVCDNVFLSSLAQKVKVVMVLSDNTGVTYHNQFFLYKHGQVETAPHLIELLRRDDIPLRDFEASVCPRCGDPVV